MSSLLCVLLAHVLKRENLEKLFAKHYISCQIEDINGPSLKELSRKLFNLSSLLMTRLGKMFSYIDIASLYSTVKSCV
jgi:hypothetical protein